MRATTAHKGTFRYSAHESPTTIRRAYGDGSRQVFGLSGGRIERDYWAMLPELMASSVPSTPVVPDYRCGAAPELAWRPHRIPS